MPPSVLEVRPLGFPWETVDPFLFCVHHRDAYPAGNDRLGPAASLEGRALGSDFEGQDGWRMYHGGMIPGFPQHPHRGFETVTIVRRGFIDHADSLGAAARYGAGDVQWLTAGAGVVHSEMFPLLDRERPNPLELFQIWLNLPHEDKLAPPHFSMFWGADVPVVPFVDRDARVTEVSLVAGALEGRDPPAPPPRSWASRPQAQVAIWSIRMQPGASWTLPPADARAARTLYFFEGSSIAVEGEILRSPCAARVVSSRSLAISNGDGEAELLLLQGRPIGEPVVQHGPFVMNSRAEIQQAVVDYQRTRFGGWPWPSDDPVHGRTEGRFARHADGRVERPSK